ncbi:hypothetical protein [Bradyrhizobium japonicum]|uniref:hypothetical protein n=1 Tax=Bradyrhizobium japonicum TaxID=375 RepID=UPI0033911E27
MPALTRRRSNDAPDRETWLIYFGDVRVGVIGLPTHRGFSSRVSRLQTERSISLAPLM